MTSMIKTNVFFRCYWFSGTTTRPRCTTTRWWRKHRNRCFPRRKISRRKNVMPNEGTRCAWCLSISNFCPLLFLSILIFLTIVYFWPLFIFDHSLYFWKNVMPNKGTRCAWRMVREIGVYDTCWWYSLCNFQYRQQYEHTCSYNFDCCMYTNMYFCIFYLMCQYNDEYDQY